MPTNPVGTWQDPDHETQTGTALKTNYDNAHAVAKRVVQGFVPHESSPADMRVQIDAGAVFDGAALTEVAAQQTAVIPAPMTNPRIDRTVIDRVTGISTWVQGTEAASPSPPAIPAGKLPVSQIALTVGHPAITNADITDERALWLLGGAALGDQNVFTAKQTIEQVGEQTLVIIGDSFVSPSIESYRDSASDHGMWLFKAARGTKAAPADLQDGDVIATLSARPRVGGAFSVISNLKAFLRNSGAEADWQLDTAGLRVGSPAGGHKGVGTLNAENGVYVGGERLRGFLGAVALTVSGTWVRLAGVNLIEPWVVGGGGGGADAGGGGDNSGGDGGAGGASIDLIDVSDKNVGLAAVNVATDAITLPTPSGSNVKNLRDDTKVQISSTGVLPAPLAAATDYWVVGSVGDTIQLAATKGGAAIDLTSQGTGRHTVTVISIDYTIGAAGVGGTSGNGTAGGQTSLGASTGGYCKATGGGGGVTVGNGGVGGSGSGGILNMVGQGGGGGTNFNGSSAGGSSFLGGGGRGPSGNVAGGGPGAVGGNFGGGGSGGVDTGQNGANGAPGVIFVREYS